jgi:hypothetical protein
MKMKVRVKAVVLFRENDIAAAIAKIQRMIGKYGGFE